MTTQTPHICDWCMEDHQPCCPECSAAHNRTSDPTATTSACWEDRHSGCSGTVILADKEWPPCECDCHRKLTVIQRCTKCTRELSKGEFFMHKAHSPHDEMCQFSEHYHENCPQPTQETGSQQEPTMKFQTFDFAHYGNVSDRFQVEFTPEHTRDPLQSESVQVTAGPRSVHAQLNFKDRAHAIEVLEQILDATRNYQPPTPSHVAEK